MHESAKGRAPRWDSPEGAGKTEERTGPAWRTAYDSSATAGGAAAPIYEADGVWSSRWAIRDARTGETLESWDADDADNAPRPILNGSPAQARSFADKARANSVSNIRSSTAISNPEMGRNKSMQNPSGPRPGPSAASIRSVPSSAGARPKQ